MQKNELISLVNKMCKELLVIIDEHDEATVEQVSTYLKESSEIICNVNSDNLNTVGYAESLFHNAYEEIAKKSLSSYAETSKTILELTKKHEDTLSECQEQQIDLPSLTTKFNEIQTHMSEEVHRANDIITKLTKQVKHLEEKTNLDALTKVFNRRALGTYLDNLCSSKKTPFNFHILMIDVDNFKTINDTHGHVAGDKVLIYLASILKKTLRDGDKIFRFGGEEFVIILNRIDDTHCKIITKRLLQLVRDNKLIYKGKNIRTTISIGTTKFVKDDIPDTLLHRADKALYKAKSNGKDQMQTEVKDGI